MVWFWIISFFHNASTIWNNHHFNEDDRVKKGQGYKQTDSYFCCRMAGIKRPLLTSEAAWQNLQKYYDENGSKINMPEMFKEDEARFDKLRFL